MLEGLFCKDNNEMLLLLLVLCLCLGDNKGFGGIFGGDNMIWILILLFFCLGDGFC